MRKHQFSIGRVQFKQGKIHLIFFQTTWWLDFNSVAYFQAKYDSIQALMKMDRLLCRDPHRRRILLDRITSRLRVT